MDGKSFSKCESQHHTAIPAHGVAEIRAIEGTSFAHKEKHNQNFKMLCGEDKKPPTHQTSFASCQKPAS